MIRKRNAAELRMHSSQREFPLVQIEREEIRDRLCAEPREFIKQSFKRFSFDDRPEAVTVERIEGPRLAVLQNDSRARNPIRQLAENKVPQNIHHRKCTGRNPMLHPLRGLAAQHRIQYRGRFRQDLNCFIDSIFHSLSVTRPCASLD